MSADALVVLVAISLAALVAGVAVLACYRWGVLRLWAVIVGAGVVLTAAVAVVLQLAGDRAAQAHGGVLFWTVVPLFAGAPPVIATLATVTTCARLRAPRWLAFVLTTAACLGGIGFGYLAGILAFVALSG